MAYMETTAEVILRHAFMAGNFASFLAALIVGSMRKRTPKQFLPRRRKATAILLITLMFPTAFLLAYVTFEILDGVPLSSFLSFTSALTATNGYTTLPEMYLVLLIVNGCIWLFSIRKFPIELPQDKMPPMPE